MASEAQLCAEEFVRLVKRARPDWLRSIADMATVAKFNRRWTKEWWKWAAENSDKAHEIVMGGDDVAPEATLTQRDNRRKMLNDSFASDFNHLLVSAEPRSAEVYLPGWHGHQVEGWRFEIAARYWRSMSTTRGRPGYDGMVETMRQWIGSYVDLRTAVSDPVDFANLWLCEATPHDVPRDWIRAALAYTQTTMKIGPGNARDEQHSAYLVDAHLFLSADRRLVAALQEVRRQALFPLAEPRITDLQNGARSALDAIAVALS
jgi:hypothetical protein